jgi:biopolymer transport protein TolR
MSMSAAESDQATGRKTWRRRRRRKAFSDINVTPLVDVMLVLLVIFIVTAPSMKEGVDVELPHTTGTPGGGQAPSIFTITIDSLGKVYVANKTLEQAEIETQLPALLKGHENEVVSLKADSNARQGTMVKVYGALRVAGIHKINFPVAGKN